MRLATQAVVLLLAAVADVASADATAWRANLAPEASARLDRGEAVVLDLGKDSRGHGAQALVRIEAPAASVWSVMIDCAGRAEFVPNLRRCRLLERGSRTRLVEHRVKAHALLPVLTYRFRERWVEGRRIDFARVGGDLAAMSGAWELEGQGDAATLVRYTLRLDPGFLVPDRAVKRALRRDLPLLLDALRDRVEGERAAATRERGAAPR